MAKDHVLEKSLQSAYLTVLNGFMMYGLTFAIGAIQLRQVSKEYLGSGVRFALFTDTVLFLSRWAFRKACLSKPKNGDWRGTVNLVWMALPLGALVSLGLGYVWLNVLEPPKDPDKAEQYQSGIYFTGIVILLILSSEIFYIIGQAYMEVAFRSAMDLFTFLFGILLNLALVTWDPSRAILLAAASTLINLSLNFVIQAVYFHWRASCGKLGPFRSFADFLPDLNPMRFRIDWERFCLSVSFFKQGILKQILTEGEKYMITWFGLLSIGELGVYNTICNLAYVPAKHFFSQLEDSVHLYFSQKISRGEIEDFDKEKEPSR